MAGTIEYFAKRYVPPYGGHDTTYIAIQTVVENIFLNTAAPCGVLVRLIFALMKNNMSTLSASRLTHLSVTVSLLVTVSNKPVVDHGSLTARPLAV